MRAEMEQNVFYSETKFIIETVLKTAVDVIGAPKQEQTTEEVRCASITFYVYIHISVRVATIKVKALIPCTLKIPPQKMLN